MLHYTVLLLCVVNVLNGETSEELVVNLRDDANLDLSTDNEYEDLRAELLASHTALAKLIDRTDNTKDARRAKGGRRMSHTPCWALGGICVNVQLCSGEKYLTKVAGCRGEYKVCCFVWNKYNVKDMKEYGFSNLAMPWSLREDFGDGDGIIEIDTSVKR